MTEEDLSHRLPAPFQYLKDFHTIEEYRFGRWRLLAIIGWLTVLVFAIAGAALARAVADDGITWFVRVHFQIMSNVALTTLQERPHLVFDLPLVKPLGYLCACIALVAFPLLIRALLHRSEKITHTLPEAPVATD